MLQIILQCAERSPVAGARQLRPRCGPHAGNSSLRALTTLLSSDLATLLSSDLVHLLSLDIAALLR